MVRGLGSVGGCPRPRHAPMCALAPVGEAQTFGSANSPSGQMPVPRLRRGGHERPSPRANLWPFSPKAFVRVPWNAAGA